MKNSKTKPTVAVAPARDVAWWVYVLGSLALLFIAFEIYWPALSGPFVFDDLYSPFLSNVADRMPFKDWITPTRPLVSLTYWLNFQASGAGDPTPYHVVNVLLHVAAAILSGLVIRQLLEMSGAQKPLTRLLALFGGAVFLVHPMQTEAVAYVSSRSESLAVFFYMAAFFVYLRRPEGPISWGRAIGVMLLFFCAAASKEYSVTLPAILLLTDYFFSSLFSWDASKKNWRLYSLAGAGAVLASGFALRLLSRGSTSAGFGLTGIQWYEYLFTQCRAIWVYARMFALPFGQNIDPDFPVSHSLVDQGALIGLVALLAAVYLAWRSRDEYPLICYGFFFFLITIAPTSSVIPIQDVFAERRLYLPMFGLILIALDLIRRIPVTRGTLMAGMVGALFILGALTYQRNEVWSSTIALWSDAVAKAPNKWRPRFQLAFALYQEQRYVEAAEQYRQALRLRKPTFELLIDAALAFDEAGNPDEAMSALREAEKLEKNGLLYDTMGRVEGKRNRLDEALHHLDRAAQLSPGFDAVFADRGNVYFYMGRLDLALRDYERALIINPKNGIAAQNLVRVKAQMAQAK